MKKLLLALFLMFIPAMGGSITDNQLNTIITQTTLMSQNCVAILSLARAVLTVQDGGFTIGGSTNTVSLSAQQQTDITAAYSALKSALQTEYLALP